MQNQGRVRKKFMVKTELLYLSQADVAAVGLSMAEIIKALEIAFRDKGEGKTEVPPKPGIHPGGSDNFIHAMPAYIPSMKSAGVKWVSGFVNNYKRNLPYITGVLILNDVETGIPISVMDCVWITAMRTGAATALSARYLARPESSVAGILGCGVQGRTNLEALKVLFPLRRVVAYDINPEATASYAQEMEKRFEVEVIRARKPREAVSGCDIIVTAGPILKKPHRTIQADWMDEGSFASLVDFDSYWHPDALRMTSKFCTDDTAQFLQYKSLGYFQDVPPVYADLGDLVTNKKIGRETSVERTMAVNLGLAIDDMAVAPLIYRRALEMGFGTKLAL